MPARELRSEEEVSGLGLGVAIKSAVVRHAGRDDRKDDAALGYGLVARGTQ